MRVIHMGFFGVSGLLLVACAGISTPASHAQEAAQNIAENERFGRVELVLQKVAPSERAAFVASHAAWGGRITIADTELGNFHMTGGGTEDAEMNLRVTWYDAGEQELRSTLLRQKWHGPKGDWLLVSEERIDGDLGLLGEKIIVQTPDVAPTHAQFPTIRIGAVE
jgi:hypothetical protein